MSRRIPEEQYEKTLSFRLKQWLDGTRDPYLNNVEMQPQKPFQEEEAVVHQREVDRESIRRNTFSDSNAGILLWNRLYRLFSVVFCIALVSILLYGISFLPSLGDSHNPANNVVAQRYIENGLQETGAVNIVTGMILDYRAFDTLGESHVLFIATCTVLILLRKDKKKFDQNSNYYTEEDTDSYHEPKDNLILQSAARILVPAIAIFGIYVILGGHLGPGGGFSGGAIVGAALILHLNAFGFEKTERFFHAKTYKTLSICALGCYAMAKSYSFYTGANHIESIIPLGTPGAIFSSGLILILNICVGVVVAGTMYTFYVMFRKGDF